MSETSLNRIYAVGEAKVFNCGLFFLLPFEYPGEMGTYTYSLSFLYCNAPALSSPCSVLFSSSSSQFQFYALSSLLFFSRVTVGSILFVFLHVTLTRVWSSPAMCGPHLWRLLFCTRAYWQHGQGPLLFILHLHGKNGSFCGLKFHLWLMLHSDLNK